MELVLGAARIDLVQLRVERGGVSRRLTHLEGQVLRYLVGAGDRTVSRDELLTAVWGHRGTSPSRVADTLISRVRRKVEADPSNPRFVVTVHGEGYRLVQGGAASPPPRPEPAPERRYPLGDGVLDLGRLQVERPSGSVALTGREVALLEVLVAANGASVDRDRLQRGVWGSAVGRPLEAAVVRLRRKIEVDPSHPRSLIRTSRGYRLQLGI